MRRGILRDRLLKRARDFFLGLLSSVSVSLRTQRMSSMLKSDGACSKLSLIVIFSCSIDCRPFDQCSLPSQELNMTNFNVTDTVWNLFKALDNGSSN